MIEHVYLSEGSVDIVSGAWWLLVSFLCNHQNNVQTSLYILYYTIYIYIEREGGGDYCWYGHGELSSNLGGSCLHFP